MEVVNGLPVFNDTGKGQQVPLEMINQTISFLAASAKPSDQA